ncbi:hypothetical protein Dda_5489 [Drechslerella dactyloides]|uniref:Uncharacterized protein n=1 Tax=Drechslerella dactyloides TaxID=74499 RepID=A0AAD6IWW2_DREDA|nr:hypothetical protein Dda_5489 [Drechslerella dactyloides]
MSQRVLAIRSVISTLLFLIPGVYTQSATEEASTATQPTLPSATSSPRTQVESGISKFWKKNWQWFLIALGGALIPILLWAILGPGRRWYRARKHRSFPIAWNQVGNERFETPQMREAKGISRSRGGSGSSTSSNLLLSMNAAAPAEQDIEAAARLASPKSPSAYVQHERMVRSDSTEAVIGLVQPQPGKPQSLMPPMPKSGDRTSFGSIGPPEPHVHRAHPRYNSFQRYSRQHRKGRESLPTPVQASELALSPQNQSLHESMQLLMNDPSRKSTPERSNQRTSAPMAGPSTGRQQIFLPQPPRSKPYHQRQPSPLIIPSRSTSWHHTTEGHRASQMGLHSTRHASIDGYMSVPELAASPVDPRRPNSRGRLQKPQPFDPRRGTGAPQIPPIPTSPRTSFYRAPSNSREGLGWPLTASPISPVPILPIRPTVPRPIYPARSAMSVKSGKSGRSIDERIHGVESSYSVSITGGNTPAKSVKFAALPPINTGLGRFPVNVRHF